MAVFVSNIVIEQGFTFTAAFELENTETAGPLDMNGFSLSSKLKKTHSSSSSTEFTSSITNASNGLISISLSDTQTKSLKPGRYVYDIRVVNLNGNIEKVVEGSALVRPGVTL